MKVAGSTFEYEDARNKDLMRAYREALRSPETKSAADVYRKVAEMPTSRFWVSEERAAIVIAAMLNGKSIGNMRPNKREMYEEIYRRVVKLRQSRPDASIYDLVFEVVQQPAPKFYLTSESARIIIHYINTGCYARRNRKRKHVL